MHPSFSTMLTVRLELKQSKICDPDTQQSRDSCDLDRRAQLSRATLLLSYLTL